MFVEGRTNFNKKHNLGRLDGFLFPPSSAIQNLNGRFFILVHKSIEKREQLENRAFASTSKRQSASLVSSDSKSRMANGQWKLRGSGD
ncbi:hypothetical protein, partial [Shouchella clausii]|uniref:hypothetical protein n=1 Tax=Shouchella clausii TaxID=79880 RepID=UPI00280BD24E